MRSLIGGRALDYQSERHCSKTSQQDQCGDYSDRNSAIMTPPRERDAQRYLLSEAERYNIPKSETAQTRKALEGYLQKLKEAGIDEG